VPLPLPQPLPLALDFSAACLRAAQRRWLLEPAQAGRVEAASFHAEDTLWEQPLVENFLALHGGALLHLSGVPLPLVARADREERPALDLSGLRLTKLGINISKKPDLGPTDFEDLQDSRRSHVWLWPERLPGTLEELDLLGLEGSWATLLAWAPEASAGLAGRLPWLQTLSCRCKANRNTPYMSSVSNIPLLEGFTTLPHLDVAGMSIRVGFAIFDRCRSVRIVAHGVIVSAYMNEDVAMFVDRICHAGLQAAELCAEQSHIHLSATGSAGAACTPQVVHAMIDRHGDRFAIEVGILDKALEPWRQNTLHRLAWRRWPVPGAPGLPAAMAAHERARAWAAEGTQQLLQQ